MGVTASTSRQQPHGTMNHEEFYKKYGRYPEQYMQQHENQEHEYHHQQHYQGQHSPEHIQGQGRCQVQLPSYQECVEYTNGGAPQQGYGHHPPGQYQGETDAQTDKFAHDPYQPQFEEQRYTTPLHIQKKEYDESRDTILSRILSADEFLDRMKEADESIAGLTKMDDRDTVYKQLKELVGLRSHLQDELLRIEAMFDWEDPLVQEFFEEFIETFPAVVAKLQELHVKAKVIHAVTIARKTGQVTDYHSAGVGLTPEFLQSIAAETDSSEEEDETDSSEYETDSEDEDEEGAEENGAEQDRGARAAGASGGAETKGHDGPRGGVDTNMVDIKVDDKLKKKHDQQEEKVTENYTQKMLIGGELSKEVMDRVLQDHLVTMQTLRTKQEVEKERMRMRLKAKMRARKGAKVEKSSTNEDKDESGSANTKKVRGVTGVTSMATATDN